MSLKEKELKQIQESVFEKYGRNKNKSQDRPLSSYGVILEGLLDEVLADDTLSATQKLEAIEVALRANMHLVLK